MHRHRTTILRHHRFQPHKAGDNLQLIIKKGNTFSITAEGCANELANLKFAVGSGDMLHIDYNNPGKPRQPVTFTITLPLFVHLVLSGTAKATIEGFAGQSSVIRTIRSGASQCVVTGTAINANFDLSGSSQLTLAGTTESLYGSVSGSSVLNSYGVVATEVDMTASGSAVA